jgi:Mg-chelatase subunit ChlD
MTTEQIEDALKEIAKKYAMSGASDVARALQEAYELGKKDERERDKKDYFPFTPKDWPT